MSDTRETKILDLPSGLKAKVVTFFTRGEVRAIKKSRWTGTEISVDENEKPTGKLDPAAEDYFDDEIVFQGVKAFVEGETEKPITRELVDNLNIKDFDVCLKELRALFLGKGKK